MNNEVQQKVEEEEKITTEKTIGKENIKPEETGVAKNSSSLPSETTKLSNEDLRALDYDTFNTPAKMLALANVLVKGKMCPLKEPADVVIALMTGNELGLSPINSLNEIYPINGKPSLGVHIMKGMAMTNSILYEKSRDYEAKYLFVEKGSDGKPKLIDKKPVIVSQGFLDEQPENTLKSEIDRVTEYTFTRYIKIPTGQWKEITAKGSFSLSEAKQAGLDDKDNWKKYPKRMLEARAFSVGMREIADDVVKGMKTADELTNGDIVIDTEAEIIN